MTALDVRYAMRLYRAGRWLRDGLSRAFRTAVRPPRGTHVCDLEGVKLWLDLSQPNQRQMADSGTFERGATDVLLRMLAPGDVFVDVGAHVGWYALTAVMRGPGIRIAYAYEPSRHTFELLQRSIAANGCEDRCDARRVAVAAWTGTRRLSSFVGVDSMHASLYPLGDLAHSDEDVECTTLDAEACRFVAGPSIVKCDVEGAEREVLAGAAALMRGELGAPPIWLLETNYETAAMAGFFPWQLIEDAAQHNRYEAYYIRGSAVRRLAEGRSLRHGDMILLAVASVHGDRLRRAGYVASC